MFVFKQKTAYEMRISDWSSDVCSSDLIRELSLADRSVHGPRDPPETLRKRRRQKRARPEDAHPAAARSPRCHPAPPLAKPMADQLPCCPHHHIAQKQTSQTAWQRHPCPRSPRTQRKGATTPLCLTTSIATIALPSSAANHI